MTSVSAGHITPFCLQGHCEPNFLYRHQEVRHNAHTCVLGRESEGEKVRERKRKRDRERETKKER